MKKIEIKGYAKINLTLDVVGKRQDGYHFVEMIMQQVDLHDTIFLEPHPEEILLTSDSGHIPLDSQNLAWRAAALVKETAGLKSGVKIHIQKQIPVSAGLAGGSTDAASVIEGMDKLFDLNWSLEKKMELGLKLGADVPFCLMGGAALAQGIGEKLTPITGLQEGWLVVAKPDFGVSTQEVYSGLQWEQIALHPNTQAMLGALSENDFSSICSGLGNVLEDVTLKAYPEVKVLKDKMVQYGAQGALMSGSGPTVFGIFKTQEKAEDACNNLKRQYQQSFVVRTILNRGDEA